GHIGIQKTVENIMRTYVWKGMRAQVAQFIKDENLDAWRDILSRFQEAIDRGLWHPKRNATGETLLAAKKSAEQ
ncbi:MAG: hypothetical protein ACPHW5_03415, partial [Candidatus Puniceispirillales bacterium]